MIVASVAVAAFLGALVGSVLTVVAWRVPRDVPLLAGRPVDGAGQRSFLAAAPAWNVHVGKAAGPRMTTDVAIRPPVLELITAALFAVMVLRFGLSWTLPAYLTLATMAVLLAVIDLQHQRLPNVIVGPFAIAALALLIIIVGALQYFSGRPQPPSSTAFIVPSQSVRW